MNSLESELTLESIILAELWEVVSTAPSCVIVLSVEHEKNRPQRAIVRNFVIFIKK